MLGAVRVSSDTLTPLIESIANKYGVDPAIIKGIIQQESAWDVNASRYEAHLNDSSWGLMQVLLKTAKWILGNDKLTISDLVNPQINVEAGTKFIASLLKQYKGNIRDAISAYNAGSPRRNKDGTYVNQSYVDKVYRNYMMYRTMGFAVTEQTAAIGIGSLFALAAVGMVAMRAK